MRVKRRKDWQELQISGVGNTNISMDSRKLVLKTKCDQIQRKFCNVDKGIAKMGLTVLNAHGTFDCTPNCEKPENTITCKHEHRLGSQPPRALLHEQIHAAGIMLETLAGFGSLSPPPNPEARESRPYTLIHIPAQQPTALVAAPTRNDPAQAIGLGNGWHAGELF